MKPRKGAIEVHCARVGGCSRALAFHILKVREGPLSPKVREIYDEGERLERVIGKQLQERGYFPEKGKQLRSSLILAGEKVEFLGTPDFIVKYKGERVPLEAKTMNRSRFFRLPRRFEDWVDPLKFKYSYQLRGYLHLCNANTILFVGKEKVKGNGSDGPLKELVLHSTDEGLPTWGEFEARIERALKVFKGEEILPEKYEKCEWCPYNYTCFSTSLQQLLGKSPNRLKDIVEDDNNFMRSLVDQREKATEYRELLEKADERYKWFQRLWELKYKFVP